MKSKRHIEYSCILQQRHYDLTNAKSKTKAEYKRVQSVRHVRSSKTVHDGAVGLGQGEGGGGGRGREESLHIILRGA